MKPLVTRLKLTERSESQDEYERRHARAVATRHAYEHLRRRNSQGLLSDHSWEIIGPLLQEHNRTLANSVQEVMSADPQVEQEELDTARREYLRAQRSAINGLRRDGTISDEIFNQLIAEIDAAITSPSAGWPELLSANLSQQAIVNRLMAVIVQEQDVENALSALTKLGIPTTRLPSTGGFFRRTKSTLLIGIETGQEASVVRALQLSCHKRVEYISAPVEGFPPDLAEPVPITVGGATIFVFEVERFEAF